MAGQHLRRARRAWLRRVLTVLGVLLVGVAVGAGGALVEDGSLRLGTGEGADGDGRAPGTARLVPEPGPVTIAVGGHVPVEAVQAGLASGAELLGPFAGAVAEADLSVVGLEGPVAVAEGDPAGDPDDAHVPELDALLTAGVDAVSLANDGNLTGAESLYRLLAVREVAGSPALGVGTDEAEAYGPLVRDVSGNRVAVLAATQLLDAARIADATAGPAEAGVASAKRADRLAAAVADAAGSADVVVVHLHWGLDDGACPSPGQRELAGVLVDAGADVVAGSGPAHALAVERVGAGLVAYGLGSLADPGGAVLLLQVSDGRVAGHQWMAADGSGQPPARC